MLPALVPYRPVVRVFNRRIRDGIPFRSLRTISCTNSDDFCTCDLPSSCHVPLSSPSFGKLVVINLETQKKLREEFIRRFEFSLVLPAEDSLWLNQAVDLRLMFKDAEQADN